MTVQPHNRFVSCVVFVEFAVNGNQALHLLPHTSGHVKIIWVDSIQSKRMHTKDKEVASQMTFTRPEMRGNRCKQTDS